MKKILLSLTCAATLGVAHNARAEDMFSRFDRFLNTVDRAESKINRAENTAERLNKKIPEAGEDTETAQATRGTEDLTAEEQDILDKANRIEEERILREADAIRSRKRN